MCTRGFQPLGWKRRFHSLRLLPVVVFEYCGYSGSSTTSSGRMCSHLRDGLLRERMPVAHGDHHARVELAPQLDFERLAPAGG